jgi:hypothetical protein
MLLPWIDIDVTRRDANTKDNQWYKEEQHTRDEPYVHAAPGSPTGICERRVLFRVHIYAPTKLHQRLFCGQRLARAIRSGPLRGALIAHSRGATGRGREPMAPGWRAFRIARRIRRRCGKAKPDEGCGNRHVEIARSCSLRPIHRIDGC